MFNIEELYPLYFYPCCIFPLTSEFKSNQKILTSIDSFNLCDPGRITLIFGKMSGPKY